MGNDIIQITAPADGSVYIVDGDTKKIMRLCEVKNRLDIHPSVIRILAKFNIQPNFEGEAGGKE